MSKYYGLGFFLAAFVTLFFVTTWRIGVGEGIKIMEKQAIKQDCARYNPISAHFEWKDKK